MHVIYKNIQKIPDISPVTLERQIVMYQICFELFVKDPSRLLPDHLKVIYKKNSCKHHYNMSDRHFYNAINIFVITKKAKCHIVRHRTRSRPQE